jgi:tellurite resistance protein TerC
MNVTATDWVVLLGIVAALFALDLVPATLCPHAVGFRGAAAWSGFFAAAAAAGFAVILASLEGEGYATQFIAGYIVELSLSVRAGPRGPGRHRWQRCPRR